MSDQAVLLLRKQLKGTSRGGCATNTRSRRDSVPQNPLLAPETWSNRAEGRVPRAPFSSYTPVSAHAFPSPRPPSSHRQS